MTATSKKPTEAATSTTPEACSTPIDREAPAGSPGSLGSKSDCNGRPATDDSVVEAKDEVGPGVRPPVAGRDARR
jgi:hypothetical protein